MSSTVSMHSTSEAVNIDSFPISLTVAEADTHILAASSLEHSDEACGPAPLSRDERSSEGQTTASEGHSCAVCGKELPGRKERFCSDACWMRSVRERQHDGARSCSTPSLMP